MDKKDDDQTTAPAAAAPAAAKPAVKPAAARWPGQSPNAGMKFSKSLQGRKMIGRGSSRGR